MEEILMHPHYFGPVSQFAAMVKAKKVIFENEDNYQKQTYRNRMYIYGANGKLLLNIPVKHIHKGGNHQKYKDVRIENNFDWQKLHWKSLESAYRSSPFFEFFEDEIEPLYRQSFKFLIDFNYKCLETVLDCLQMDLAYEKTSEYIAKPENRKDLRFLVNAKQEIELEQYHQVFENKNGFISNLSILDLLFNEGNNALQYLENSNTNFISAKV